MSNQEAFFAAFSPDELPTVRGIMRDIEGMAHLFGVDVGDVAWALIEVGQERLDTVTTKRELGRLVAEQLLTPESVEVADRIMAEVDSRYVVPPPADFKLFSRVHEAVMAYGE